MLVYILKSVACLAILFVFYKIFLEKENMHVFKRFYLLGALVISLIIPAIVFTEYVEVIPTTNIQFVTPGETGYSKDAIQVPQALDKDINDIAPLLWIAYFIGLFFFGFKFLRNLFQIFRRIRKNPKHKLSRFTQVLLQETIPPHTFFSYIFLNKMKLESNEIPKEVLLHEETHASQKHSYDVVIVELLQVIFWVNPLVYFFKKAIKLNHEFLADQAVLKKSIDKATYQNTLLSYLSPDSKKKYQPKLANAINYSSIKKRFTIMKTQTSKKAIYLRTLLLLPLLTVLLYGFSETKEERIMNQTVIEKKTTSPDINKKNDFSKLITQDKSDKNNWPPTINDFEKWTTNESDFIIYVHGKPISKENLARYHPSNFYHFTMKLIPLRDRSENFPQSYRLNLFTQEEYNEIPKTELAKIKVLVKKNGEILINNKSCRLNNLVQKLQEVQSDLNKNGKKGNIISLAFDKGTSQKITNEVEEIIRSMYTLNAALKNNTSSSVDSLKSASKKQIAEYNDLAKKYNSVLSKSKSIQIKMKDVERLEYIYGLMTDKQKAAAEPFPDFPEPPPPPPAPRVKKGEKSDIPPPPAPRVKQGEKSDIPPPPEFDNEKFESSIQDIKESIQRSRYIKGEVDTDEVNDEEMEAYIQNQIASQEINAEENVRIYQYGINFSSIDTSPGLKSTLKDLANREAQFYFNGKKVSTQKGMQIVKNKKNITIGTFPYTHRKPEVRIEIHKNDVSIPPPPNPPTPISPLDHVIEMAKKDAKFYFEGKAISSDKAIELIKNNDEINIDSRASNGKQPVVRLSTEPITIGN